MYLARSVRADLRTALQSVVLGSGAVCSFAFAAGPPAPVAQFQSVVSPDGTLRAEIGFEAGASLSYRLTWHGQPLGGPGRIGLRFSDGGSTRELGARGQVLGATSGSIDESYPFLGAKVIARNNANTLLLVLREADRSTYRVEARAYDNGFAWRVLLGNTHPVRVLAETSTWSLPEGEVWFSERNNAWKLKSYAGEFRRAPVNAMPSVSSQGPLQTAPLLEELPHDTGYLLLTEAALAEYSGMRLRASGNRVFGVDFTEGAQGFQVTGPVTTPWRVTMLCRDLNCLVNNTLTENLNPAPDPVLFRDMSYIRPGRSVWRYMSRQTGTPEQEREFVDAAATLGFEYTLVDDGWKRWVDAWSAMAELVHYAATKHVGVFAWKDANDMLDSANDYSALRDFLDRAQQSGLAGVKIDFINGESKAKVDFERRALLLAAERRLMVDFHGIQKPTGEERTFPNGLTREAVRGIELNHMREGPVTASHNAALPFTRFAVGPADYTPLYLQWPGETTWAHQVATAVLLSSPLLVIAEDPDFLLHSPDVAPALPLVKQLPTTWDETLVLPSSRVGGVVGMARRKGAVWYIAAINGTIADATMLPLPSTICLQQYTAVVLRSPTKRSLATHEYRNAADWQPDERLTPGDGLVVTLTPRTSAVLP